MASQGVVNRRTALEFPQGLRLGGEQRMDLAAMVSGFKTWFCHFPVVTLSKLL